MPYLGNTPTTQSFISGTDYFNGTGAQTAFTLTRTVASVNDIEAVVNNVVQQPNDAYTISGTTITFTSAPSAGTSNVYVRYLSTTTQAISPSQGTVGWAQLNSDTQQDLGISFKNRIINGAMVIDQRNAGASITPTAGTYTLDRWQFSATQASKLSIQQSSVAPTGFSNSVLFTSLSSYSINTGDFFLFNQWIEGFNAADLMWGTANAKTVTLSFWVQSSLTGTFGGSFTNSAQNRSYPFSYTISSANTWEQKTITVAGDTSGTWIGATNGRGIGVWFGLGVNAVSNSGTAGAWASAAYYSATGATSVVSTNGATFYLTGVQLEVGTQATIFDNRSYGTELQLCQRYYETSYNQGGNPQSTPTNTPNSYMFLSVGSNTFAGGTNAAQQIVGPLFYKVTKRALPTVTIYSYTSSTTNVASNGWTGSDLAASTGSLGDTYLYGFDVCNKSGSNASTGGYGIIFGYSASAEL
jgi:hypothetical protein